MKIVHASFWFAAIGSSLMGIALMVPIWLGRKRPDSSMELHGAFYQFLCQHGSCETFARVLSSASAPLDGRQWEIEIAAMPAVALIGFLLCFTAVTILEIISCRCCGDRLRTRRVIFLVNIILIASAFFAGLAVFIAFYVCSEYYKDDDIDHAAEIPWSVLLYTIATVLVIFAILMFTSILLRWERYKEHYGHYGSLGDDYLDGGRYKRHDESLASRSRRSPNAYETGSYNNPGYLRQSSFTSMSDFGRPRSESGYFNYPGKARSVLSAGSVMRSSGRSLTDSPNLDRSGRRRDKRTISGLTRSASYEDFIDMHSERSAKRPPYARSVELHRKPRSNMKLPPVPWDTDSIDPHMLKSGNTRYRESMLD